MPRIYCLDRSEQPLWCWRGLPAAVVCARTPSRPFTAHVALCGKCDELLQAGVSYRCCAAAVEEGVVVGQRAGLQSAVRVAAFLIEADGDRGSAGGHGSGESDRCGEHERRPAQAALLGALRSLHVPLGLFNFARCSIGLSPRCV
jgi:hypothetical protein